MKLGIRLPTYALPGEYSSFAVLREYVQNAEEMGVQGFFVIDHTLTSRPAYSCSWQDAMTTLAFVAAATRHARIGPMVLVLPIRNPYLLAKQAATLDNYSAGRFVMGVGVGWNPDEFRLLGTPLEKRGAIMDEYLELLRRLWTEDRVTFHGKFFNVEDLELSPKPAQNPAPPLWIGGGSQPHEIIYGQPAKGIDRVLARVAKYADGWIPHSSATSAMAHEDWMKVKRMASELGRDPYSMDRIYSNFVYVKEPGEGAESIAKRFRLYSGMGFSYWTSFYLLGRAEEIREKIREKVASVEGVSWLVLNPVTFERRQLEKIVEEIYKPLEGS